MVTIGAAASKNDRPLPHRALIFALIASLASLITFREYLHHEPRKARSYIAIFSAFNFGFLFLLLGFMLIRNIPAL